MNNWQLNALCFVGFASAVAAGRLWPGSQKAHLTLPEAGASGSGVRVNKESDGNTEVNKTSGDSIGALLTSLTRSEDRERDSTRLLESLDREIAVDPAGVWASVVREGEKGVPLRRWVANRIGLAHGAALIGEGGLPEGYLGLPPTAFLSGCARRPDAELQVTTLMKWNDRRGRSSFPGRMEALREFAKEWGKAKRTGGIPLPNEAKTPAIQKLIEEGVEAGLAEAGAAGRIASCPTLGDWSAKSGPQEKQAGDGNFENCISSSRAVMQILEKAGDPAKALKLATQSGAGHVIRELIALSAAMRPESMGAICLWAKSSPSNMGDVAGAMGTSCPDAGLKWIQELQASNDPQASTAASKFLESWAVVDPGAAIKACLGGSQFKNISGVTYAAALSQLQGQKPDEVRQLWESFSNNENVPSPFRNALMEEMSRNQPEYFQNLVASGKETGLSSDALQMWLSRLAVKQGLAGAEWALANTEGIPRDQVTGAVVRGLALKDPVGASNFANSLEPGPEKDGAAAALVSLTVATEPVSAFEWAMSITDPRLRERAIGQSLESLKKAKQDLAPYLQRAHLSEWAPMPSNQ